MRLVQTGIKHVLATESVTYMYLSSFPSIIHSGMIDVSLTDVYKREERINVPRSQKGFRETILPPPNEGICFPGYVIQS